MFALTYIRRELRRRAGRTIVTVLGLALGVGLVAAITSISNGLDRAQAEVLDPLGTVATDLSVTRPIGGPGSNGPVEFGEKEARALRREGRAVMTDLSSLGEPGDEFEHTSFLPATQLSFSSRAAMRRIAELDGVEAVGLGLTLNAIHQEGTVPEIFAEFETGGQTITVEAPDLTPEQQKAFEDCMRRAGPNGPRVCVPKAGGDVQVTVPRETIRKRVDVPETDIESTQFSIAGVDLTTPGLALITQGHVTHGAFLSGPRAHEALVASGYAERQELEIGDEIDLNGTAYTIVGVVKPPLGGQASDVYLPLGELQELSNREGRANVVLVRATDASAVAGLEERITDAFDGAEVTSAEDVAETVSGSLVDAANLADRLGLVVGIVLLVAAFLIAILLTLSSVAKRVRELGTLKAIGWSKARVVRQVVGESLAQGAMGGALGVAVGIAAAMAIAAWVPPLQASSGGGSDGGVFPVFGPGALAAAATQTETISLSAPIDAQVVLIAFGLALVGGLVAGAAGALRAARLRPADALREVG